MSQIFHASCLLFFTLMVALAKAQESNQSSDFLDRTPVMGVLDHDRQGNTLILRATKNECYLFIEHGGDKPFTINGKRKGPALFNDCTQDKSIIEIPHYYDEVSTENAKRLHRHH